MKCKEFFPKMEYTPCVCFPFWRCCDDENTSDNLELIKGRMTEWLKEHQDEIQVINIESLDFRTADYIFEKMHFRIWYTNKE